MVQIQTPPKSYQHSLFQIYPSGYTNGLDNSGDYTKYEKNELLPVGDGVNLNVRKNGDKIYVMYFAAESGVYSARCEEGMNDNEAIGIFNTIKEAETKYLNLIP